MSFRDNFAKINRGTYYSLSGNDADSGTTLESPKQTIQAALDTAAALDPTPTPFNSARVKEAQGGSYLEDLTLSDSVLFEGLQTSVISSGPIAVEAASFMSFNCQTVVNSTDNGIGLCVDGVESFGAKISALIVTGDNGVGISIKGNNDDTFYQISEVRLGGLNGTGIEVTGNSPTPFDFNINICSFAAEGQTFFRYNPDAAGDMADLNVSSVGKTPIGPVGTKAIVVNSGTLNVNAGAIHASTAVEVTDGGTLTLKGNTLRGTTVVSDGGIGVIDVDAIGGDLIAESGAQLTCHNSAILVGNINVIGSGVCQTRIETIIGNINA